MKGSLKNGFEYEVCDATLDDAEFMDALAEAQENPIGLSKVANMLLGKEQKAKLYDSIRNEEGRVPLEVFSDSIVEIIQKFGEEGKN